MDALVWFYLETKNAQAKFEKWIFSFFVNSLGNLREMMANFRKAFNHKIKMLMMF